MKARDWKFDVTITKEEGQQCYETQDLINRFQELEDQGYSGLSLGLIIDIIDHQIPSIEFATQKK